MTMVKPEVHRVDAPAAPPEPAEGMDTRYLVRMAWAKIRTSPRSARTYIVVAIATAFLLLSFAGINAMAGVMATSARDVIAGGLSVFHPDYSYSMLNAASDKVFYIDDAAGREREIGAIRNVTAVHPRLSVGARVDSANQQAGILVIGADMRAEGFGVLEGAAVSRPGDICLNPDLAQQLQVGVGDSVTLNLSGAPAATAAVTGRVACIFDTSRFGFMRSTHAIMALDDVQRILARPDSVTQLLVTVEPGADRAAVQHQIETGRLTHGLKVSTTEQTADLIFTIQRAQQVVMWVFVAVTAFLCAVMIGNIVQFSLRRERGEIATLRAMGCSVGQLRLVYLVQAVVLGIVMVAIGTVVALTATWALSATGIPLGAGRKLFGDSVMYPTLSVTDVVLTAGLLLVAIVVSNLAASRAMLTKPPLALLQDR